jgi:glycyl-tRNA synthetase beta subunit
MAGAAVGHGPIMVTQAPARAMHREAAATSSRARALLRLLTGIDRGLALRADAGERLALNVGQLHAQTVPRHQSKIGAEVNIACSRDATLLIHNFIAPPVRPLRVFR